MTDQDNPFVDDGDRETDDYVRESDAETEPLDGGQYSLSMDRQSTLTTEETDE